MEFSLKGSTWKFKISSVGAWGSKLKLNGNFLPMLTLIDPLSPCLHDGNLSFIKFSCRRSCFDINWEDRKPLQFMFEGIWQWNSQEANLKTPIHIQKGLKGQISLLVSTAMCFSKLGGWMGAFFTSKLEPCSVFVWFLPWEAFTKSFMTQSLKVLKYFRHFSERKLRSASESDQQTPTPSRPVESLPSKTFWSSNRTRKIIKTSGKSYKISSNSLNFNCNRRPTDSESDWRWSVTF